MMENRICMQESMAKKIGMEDGENIMVKAVRGNIVITKNEMTAFEVVSGIVLFDKLIAEYISVLKECGLSCDGCGNGCEAPLGCIKGMGEYEELIKKLKEITGKEDAAEVIAAALSDIGICLPELNNLLA